MSASTYPITSTATPVYSAGRVDTDILVENIGTTVVYLGDTNGILPANGWPLKAGSTISWPGNQALFAVSNVGETALIVAMPTSATVFDASALAGQILAQGLAQDIATAISVSGAPSIDKRTPILSTTAIDGYTSAILPASAFNSIQVYLHEINPISGNQPTPRFATIQWYSSASGISLTAYDEWSFLDDNASADKLPCAYRTPVRDDYFQLIIVGNAAPAGRHIEISVFGSYTAADNVRYEHLSSAYSAGLASGGAPGFTLDSSGAGGLFSCNFGPKFPNAFAIWPAFIAGDHDVCITIGGVTANGQIYLVDAPNGRIMAVFNLLTTTVTVPPQRIYIPPRPFSVQWTTALQGNITVTIASAKR